MYMNASWYGTSGYGAAAAAAIYFGRHPAQLDLAQAAFLAGLPQNPTLLDPLAHFDAARQRQHEGLAPMVRSHDINQAQADRASAEDVSGALTGPAPVDRAPGFVSDVRPLLPGRSRPAAGLSGGLRVT